MRLYPALASGRQLAQASPHALRVAQGRSRLAAGDPVLDAPRSTVRPHLQRCRPGTVRSESHLGSPRVVRHEVDLHLAGIATRGNVKPEDGDDAEGGGQTTRRPRAAP